MTIRIAIIVLLCLAPVAAIAFYHGNASGFLIEAPADFLLDNSSGKLLAQ